MNRVGLAKSGGGTLCIGVRDADQDFFEEGVGGAFGSGYAAKPQGGLEEAVYLPSRYGQ
jgi:hypothetical protein